MLNFLRKRKTDWSGLTNLVRTVTNSASSSLTGSGLYNFMARSRKYNTIQRGLDLSAVYCALSIYTGAVAGLPRSVFKVDTTTGKSIRKLTANENNAHPATRIYLHYANPDWMADRMFNQITNDLLIDGNFYALREYDSQSRTFRIYYIHPSRIPRGNIRYSVKGDKFNNNTPIPERTLVYKIESGQTNSSANYKSLYVTREDIVHIQGLIADPEHNRSMGIIENASTTFDMYHNSERYGSKFYENGTNNQTFLSTDQKLSPSVIKDLEGFFEKNPNAPLEEAFKTRILDMGLKPINVTIPLSQLQFIETRAFSVEDIARWFSIPPALLHSRMGSGGGSGDIASLIVMFIQFGLGPLLTTIANQLRSELLPLQSHNSYRYDFERLFLYRTVINEFSQALRNFFEIGVVDRSQIADLIGLHIDPSDKQNTQRYVPTNLMTVGHSLALEAKAMTANDLLIEQVRKATTENDNYQTPEERMQTQLTVAAAKKPPEAIVKPVDGKDDDGKVAEKDEADTSPDEHNLDKRIRTAKNAFTNVLRSLYEYELKVVDQKKSRYSDATKLSNAIIEFTNSKMVPLIRKTLEDWQPILNEVSTYNSIDDVINDWSTLTKEFKCPIA